MVEVADEGVEQALRVEQDHPGVVVRPRVDGQVEHELRVDQGPRRARGRVPVVPVDPVAQRRAAVGALRFGVVQEDVHRRARRHRDAEHPSLAGRVHVHVQGEAGLEDVVQDAADASGGLFEHQEVVVGHELHGGGLVEGGAEVHEGRDREVGIGHDLRTGAARGHEAREQGRKDHAASTGEAILHHRK